MILMKITFCGHGDVFYDENIANKLYSILTEKINTGTNIFYLGGYGNFDLLCASLLKNIKKIYPHIKIIFVAPYINKCFNNQLYDESVYPPLENIPFKFAITYRNKWMVENADCIICYVKHDWGGAFKTFKYAKKLNKEIIEL